MAHSNQAAVSAPGYMNVAQMADAAAERPYNHPYGGNAPLMDPTSYCTDPSQCNCQYDQSGSEPQKSARNINSTLPGYYLNRHWSSSTAPDVHENGTKNPPSGIYPVTNHMGYQQPNQEQCSNIMPPYGVGSLAPMKSSDSARDVRMAKDSYDRLASSGHTGRTLEFSGTRTNFYEVQSAKGHSASGNAYSAGQQTSAREYNRSADLVGHQHQQQEHQLTLIGDNNSDRVAPELAYTIGEQAGAPFMSHAQLEAPPISQHDMNVPANLNSSNFISRSLGRFDGVDGNYYPQSSQHQQNQSAVDHQVGVHSASTFDGQAARKHLNSNGKFNASEAVGGAHLNNHSSSSGQPKFSSSPPLSQQHPATYSYADQSRVCGNNNGNSNPNADAANFWPKNGSLVNPDTCNTAISLQSNDYTGGQRATSLMPSPNNLNGTQANREQSISMSRSQEGPHNQRTSMDKVRMGSGVNEPHARQQYAGGHGQVAQQCSGGPDQYVSLAPSLELSMTDAHLGQHHQAFSPYHHASSNASVAPQSDQNTSAHFSIIY